MAGVTNDGGSVRLRDATPTLVARLPMPSGYKPDLGENENWLKKVSGSAVEAA